MNNFDIIVIGAGIIGLASAFKILERDASLKVCIIEKENSSAQHQTSHNSGVIHSGIYYKPGSLKSENCLRGYKMMLDFCKQNEVKFDLCGKLIVATDESEINSLKSLYKRGLANGLKEIEIINEYELRRREPNINGIQALYVPYTGITDFKAVTKKLQTILQEKGCKIYFNTQVTELNEKKNIVKVTTSKGHFTSSYVINCSGLYSDIIARYTFPDLSIQILPFRGEYYYLRQKEKYRINSLIYPVPETNFPFLGIHITKTIDGKLETGPNAVPAFSREGYSKKNVNISELINFITYKGTLKLFKKYWKTGIKEIKMSFFKDSFLKEVRKFMPQLERRDFTKAFSGVRAQACDIKGNIIDDFLIYESERVINVCNAPSPAATASLSIGKSISDLLLKKVNLV